MRNGASKRCHQTCVGGVMHDAWVHVVLSPMLCM